MTNLSFKDAFLGMVVLWFTLPNMIAAQFSNTSWYIPMKVTIENIRINLIFATQSGATENFNNGVDILAPPPGFSPYAYFRIHDFPYFLSSDYRAPDAPTEWEIHVLNTSGAILRLIWDSSMFPNGNCEDRGSLIMNHSIDMLEQNTCQFSGDQILTIGYTPPITTVSSSRNEIQMSFVLLQNYPNPFNSATVITYTVNDETFYSLDINDIAGRRVKALASEKKTKGVYNIIWDGTDDESKVVVSGIYLCQLTSKAHYAVIKMIFAK